MEKTEQFYCREQKGTHKTFHVYLFVLYSKTVLFFTCLMCIFLFSTVKLFCFFHVWCVPLKGTHKTCKKTEQFYCREQKGTHQTWKKQNSFTVENKKVHIKHVKNRTVLLVYLFVRYSKTVLFFTCLMCIFLFSTVKLFCFFHVLCVPFCSLQ
jgi:hypothetical protein